MRSYRNEQNIPIVLRLENKELLEFHAVYEVFAQGFEIPVLGKEFDSLGQFRRDGYIDDGSHGNLMNITGVTFIRLLWGKQRKIWEKESR